MAYFINENLFSSNQYGFQPGYTTTDCLIDRIKGITISLDQGNYVVSLFLDLSKAFDTVNHLILLEKLNYYGLQQSEVYWFRPYLCSRIQQIYVSGVSLIFILSFLAYLKVPYWDLSYFLSISTIFLSQLLIFLVDYTLMIHL